MLERLCYWLASLPFLMTSLRKLFSKMTLRSQHQRRLSYGQVIRNYIHLVTLTLHPYVVKVIPNFRAAHYTYIIFMSFLVSVIMYPISNFRYIDILFLTSGACTQAGLNTINLNELKLLQQIVVYITTTLTTPIFIHGSLLFVRLYWFERHFDDIKTSSKMNFKMRRNATLAARTKSLDSTMMNTKVNQALGMDRDPVLERNTAAATGLSTTYEVPTASQSSSSTNPKLLTSEKENGGNMYSEPSDDDQGPRVAPDDIQLKDLPAPHQEVGSPQEGIKFADLPHPAKRREEVEPSDMYKSIAMLQHKRRDSGLLDDVLVIKSPKEIERDKNTPIFTKKTPLHFGSPRRPSKWNMPKITTARRKKRSALIKTLSNNSSPFHRRRTNSFQDNEDESINSDADLTAMSDNDNNAKRSNRNGNRKSIDIADDGDDEQDELENENASIVSIYSDDDNAIMDTDEEEADKATKLDSPSKGPTDRKTKFAQEPTIERKARLSKLRSKRGSLRRWRTPNFSKLTSRGTDMSNILPDERDDDDEEVYDLDNPLSRTMSTNYLSWEPKIGRNSTFVHLTDEQKEELGGVEYRAVKLLIKIVFIYYIGFHILAFSLFVGFINIAKGYAHDMREYGLSPTWWGFFTAQSVFNDLGLTLTPNSMATFSLNVYVLVISCFFIVIGNTGFPIFLRFIIWLMFKTAKPLSLYKESLGFLLDHPRRCFTLLFPSVPTWWLFFILVVLNATDLVLFIILDLNSDYLLSIPTPFRVLDGLFQAFSTRTAGFSVVDLSQLHPAVQVSYMIMMYISVLPLAISIRRTNVYEEQSLGVYLRADEPEVEKEDTPKNFIGAHLRNQLSFDLWFIFLGLFIICCAEGGKLNQNNYRFTVFTVLFEIISAYGTVGLSLGYPNINQSFSYEFTTVSKLVIIAMMIRG